MGMPLKRILRSNWPYWLCVGIVAIALKFHYSRAEIDELQWVLAPTTRLVSLFRGVEFVWNADVGYIATGHNVIVTAACAGVNFVVISFCMPAINFVGRARTWQGKLALLLGSALAAYGFTLVVNACRIALTLRIAEAPMMTGWSPESIHRFEGVMVYFTALVLLYVTAESLYQCWNLPRSDAPGGAPSRRLTLSVPLFWYLLIVVGIPFLRLPYHGDAAHFLQHAAIVLAITGAIVLAIALLRWGFMHLGPTKRSVIETTAALSTPVKPINGSTGC